jgi:hypothetical protein
MKDHETIARKIDELVLRLRNELADTFVQNCAGNLDKVTSEQERLVEYICIRAARDALAQFPKLNRADQMKLKSRAILTAKSAFKMRLTNLGRGRV